MINIDDIESFEQHKENNMIKDRIVSITAEDVRGACQFQYKGYLISYSTVFTPHSTKIFDENNEAVTPIEFTTVEQAIVFVDELIKDKEQERKHCPLCDTVYNGIYCPNCGY